MRNSHSRMLVGSEQEKRKLTIKFRKSPIQVRDKFRECATKEEKNGAQVQREQGSHNICTSQVLMRVKHHHLRSQETRIVDQGYSMGVNKARKSKLLCRNENTAVDSLVKKPPMMTSSSPKITRLSQQPESMSSTSQHWTTRSPRMTSSSPP